MYWRPWRPKKCYDHYSGHAGDWGRHPWVRMTIPWNQLAIREAAKDDHASDVLANSILWPGNITYICCPWAMATAELTTGGPVQCSSLSQASLHVPPFWHIAMETKLSWFLLKICDGSINILKANLHQLLWMWSTDMVAFLVQITINFQKFLCRCLAFKNNRTI